MSELHFILEICFRNCRHGFASVSLLCLVPRVVGSSSVARDIFEGLVYFLTCLPLFVGNGSPSAPPSPTSSEIQLELEMAGHCWLPARPHRPGFVSSTSGSV